MVTNMEHKLSQSKLYRIPIRHIVANTNPRNPLAPALQNLGWTALAQSTSHLTDEIREASKNIWELAASDDPERRSRFIKLMQEYDPEFVSWAATFLTQGQLEPVELRDNGKLKDGSHTYTLVFGCRRCLAILYNWCLTGKPAEPVVEAMLAKGNNVTLLHRAVVENRRQQPTVLEEAQAIRLAIHSGQTETEVAQEYGYSPQTIRSRLELLELPISVQRKIAAGTLKPTKALAAQQQQQQQPGDSQLPSAASGKPRIRKRQEIEEAIMEFTKDKLEYRILSWVLGKVDSFRD